MSTTDTLATHAGRYDVVAAATTVTFRTKAMWVLPVKGSFRVAGGGGEVDADGRVTGSLRLDASSVSTGMGKRDAHLRTADFFDVEHHPTIDFVLHSARPLGAGRVAIEGDLTVAGQTGPLDFEATVDAAGDAVTVTASIADLDRSRWGVDFSKMGASLHTAVEVVARFRRS